MLSSNPNEPLGRLRQMCLALADGDEKLSHGMPAFHVGGRMFAYFRHDHHGDGRTSVCVRTSGRDEQDMLVEAAPDRYSWPAYLGAAGWVAVDLAAPDTDWEAVEARVRASYDLAAPKRRGRSRS